MEIIKRPMLDIEIRDYFNLLDLVIKTFQINVEVEEFVELMQEINDVDQVPLEVFCLADGLGIETMTIADLEKMQPAIAFFKFLMTERRLMREN